MLVVSHQSVTEWLFTQEGPRYMALSPWFCAHTKMREERTAEDSARRAGFEVFLPLLEFQLFLKHMRQ